VFSVLGGRLWSEERDCEEIDGGIWWERGFEFLDVVWCVDYGDVVVFGFLF
jgi:hypothetical protein